MKDMELQTTLFLDYLNENSKELFILNLKCEIGWKNSS